MRSTKGRKKTCVITVCITPKTRFSLELIARIQRNSLSGAVDICIAQVIENDYHELLKQTWNVDHKTRLENLNNLDLLSYEEEIELKELSKNA